MSMIPCPGCGLPRVEEQVAAGVVCPVCAASPAAPAAPAAPSRPVGPPTQSDPTAGLPADVGELNRSAAPASALPRWFAWAIVFLLGGAAGAAGVLGWQTAFPPPSHPESEVAAVGRSPQPLPPLPRRVEVAPSSSDSPGAGKTGTGSSSPHAPEPRPTPQPEPQPPPEPVVAPKPPPGLVAPPPELVTTIEVHKPDETYALPSTLRKGARVVLKGKVKHFKISTLDDGAVIDASGLEAEEVSVSGRVDGRSVLKVRASREVVMSNGVTGKSWVEINAPGAEVRFPSATTDTKPGAKIDGGSTVVITARVVDLRGEVNGIETRVTVNLPASGFLKAAAVRGLATVEYRVAAGKGTPDVSATVIVPPATFRKIE